MRIAVANLTGGGLSGGYRKYLARLMPLLAQDPRVRQLTVFTPAGATMALDGVAVRTYEPGHGFSALVREVVALGPDVVFVPTARWADFGRLPVVTMVRNMEPLTAAFGANAWSEKIRNLARRWEARRAATKARRVIAVSQFVRDFIVDRWNVDPDRVGVVYHGVDAHGSPVDARRDAFVFTAGSIRPARGLEDLIAAVPKLRSGVSVVIAGRVDRGAEAYAAGLRRMLEANDGAGRVTWAGQLDDGQMRERFQHCAVFVTTSRAEACPNTVLEAMSAGCASVSVDGPPMPEFYGDAALYYRAGDATRLAARVQQLLDAADVRAQLARTALVRAAAFTWEATRDRTIAELQGALS